MIWNSAFMLTPAGSDSPSTIDDRIRDLKQAIYERLVKEHIQSLASGLLAEDGYHRQGSSVDFYQATAPTALPDGTALGSAHAGRKWFNTTLGIEEIWNGSAWIAACAPPIGAVYIQGSADTAPSSLYPGTTWSNVSSEEAGLFRRFEGGDALTFGGGTQACANLTHSHGGATGGMSGNNPHIHVYYTGSSSSGSGNALQGTYGSYAVNTTATDINHTHSIASDGGSEARPVNITVRKWRRTA